jgi:sigma-E factor negative regulatory protein RseB
MAVDSACSRAGPRLVFGWLGVVLAFASAAAGAGAPPGDDPFAWLERMRDASRALNYEGVFVYRHDGEIETLRVIHRVTENGEQERLTSLNGARREVLRDRHRVTCILSDNRSVLVDESRSRGLFASALRQSDDRLRGQYRLSLAGQERVAGRLTREIRIEPADAFRYGYRLWLDEQTGLPLKSQLVDESGSTLEEFLFTTINLPDSIPDTMLEPEVSGEGFDWHTTTRGTGDDPTRKRSDLLVGWVPPGFVKTADTREPLSGGHQPTEHVVFTDGLAAFSVYLERVDAVKAPFEGLSQMGAITAFGMRLGEHQVTVIGEVPKATVDRVGRSVQRR